MRIDLTGRPPAIRAGLLSLVLVAALGLSACTTTEGTNAMTDFGTFEREVMTETLAGLGGIPRAEKEEPKMARAPLVLPKDTRSLPAPQAASKVAMLPVDSDRVQIDATGLSQADLARLRNAKVVDLRTLAGRPLTEVEAKQLTARMTAAQLTPGARPLYLPPDEYFTTVGGTDLVCLAKNGDLVPVTDKACPPEIKKALQNRGIVKAPVADKGGADMGLASGVKQ